MVARRPPRDPSTFERDRLTPAAVPDDALMDRLATGDARSLAAIHRRYAPFVLTIASRLVAPADADDVVQDVFLTIWRKHEAFDPSKGSLKSWIAQLTRRRALNVLRRDRRHGNEAPVDAVASDALEPDAALWAAHERRILRAAVDALPPDQQQALSLAFFDELTHAEVSRATGAPIGTTKTRIRLAMKRLAPMVAALAAVAIVVAFWRERDRREQALTMVTSSDVVPIRLAAAAGMPPEAHGSLRMRRGSPVIVLTTTALPQGPRYRASIRRGDRWVDLGAFRVDAHGHALLVATDPDGGSPIAEARVLRGGVVALRGGR